MRLLIFPVLYIIFVFINEFKLSAQEDAIPGLPGKDAADPAKQFQKFFDKFFKDGGKKAFKEFMKQTKKFTKVQALDGEDKDDDDDDAPKTKEEGAAGAKKKEGDDDELPTAAKAFAFYMSTYGCQKSEIYKEFLKMYNDEKFPTPEGDTPPADDKWLKKLAKKESDPDGSAKTTVEEAEKNLKDLDPTQKRMLREGEEQMPIHAQIFLKFVKTEGCPDKSLKKYKKFNELFLVEVEKLMKKGKKLPPSYYVTKAETIIKEGLDDA